MRDVLFLRSGDNRSLRLQEPSILECENRRESVKLYRTKKKYESAGNGAENASSEPL